MALATASTTDNGDPPVTIATFPNPYEAELAHAALESRGIPAVVHNDHGQYLSAGAWVQLQVASSYGEPASTLLERGPVDETAGAGTKEGPAGPPDDLAPLRTNRRIVLGRWFLYAGAVAFLFYGFLLPVSVLAFVVALWSKHDSRRAFAVAFGMQTVVAFVSMAIAGLGALTLLIPLVAFHFARAAASPEPPASLCASPYSRLHSIEIGDSWDVPQVSGPPAAWPVWFIRDAGVLLFLLAIITGLVVALSEA